MWYGWCGLLIYLQMSSVEQQTASRAVCLYKMCIQERNVRRLSFFLFSPVCCTILPTYLFVLVVVSPSHLVTYHYCCTVLCVNSARSYFSVNIQYVLPATPCLAVPSLPELMLLVSRASIAPVQNPALQYNSGMDACIWMQKTVTA